MSIYDKNRWVSQPYPVAAVAGTLPLKCCERVAAIPTTENSFRDIITHLKIELFMALYERARPLLHEIRLKNAFLGALKDGIFLNFDVEISFFSANA